MFNLFSHPGHHMTYAFTYVYILTYFISIKTLRYRDMGLLGSATQTNYSDM